MVNNIDTQKIEWLLIEDLSCLKEHIAQWQKLVCETQSNLFCSPEWIITWIEIYWQPNWQLKTILGFDDGQLIVIVPLYLQPSTSFLSLTKLYPLGQGEPEISEVLSEYQDIIIQPNNTKLYVQIAAQINKINFDQICCNALLNNAHWIKILLCLGPAKYKECGQCYLLTKQDNYLATLSKNNRSKWNKCKNKLTELKAEFIWVSEKNFKSYWYKMISFHQKRWHKKEKSGAFSAQDFVNFHQHYQKNNITKMSALLVNNQPIAINYYLQDSQTLYFYQCGWDENIDANLSPGFSLHVWSIINNPLKNYDFMMGNIKDSYKDKFGCKKTSMTNIELNLAPRKTIIKKILHKLRLFTLK